MIYRGRACLAALLYLAALATGLFGGQSDLVGSPLGEDAPVSRQIQPFLSSIENTPYNLSFYREGLKSVHSIKFKDGVENQYQFFFNRIQLSRSMNDGANRIRKLSGLMDSDFGTLGHEAFHAFKANYIDIDDKYYAMRNFLKSRAQKLYAMIPESKREVALEEAYATYIGFILQAHISVRKNFARVTDGNCEGTLRMTERVWNNAWTSKIEGYYFRDSFSEYWTDQFKGVKILITEGRKAYRDYQNRDATIYVDQDLEDLDRRWIRYQVFEGTAAPDFVQTFEKDLRVISCSEKVFPQLASKAEN